MTDTIKEFRKECQRHGFFVLSDNLVTTNNYIEYKDTNYRLRYSPKKRLLLIVNYQTLDITVWKCNERIILFWLDDTAINILTSLEKAVIEQYFES